MAFDAPAPPVRLYRCCDCRTMHRLLDLNEAMLCSECGEPDEDEDAIDLSVAGQLAEHGTWSV